MSSKLNQGVKSLKNIKRISIATITGASLIIAASLAAVGVGTWYCVSNYVPSSQYINSQRVRLALDLTHVSDNPYDISDNDFVEVEDKMKNIDRTINALSRYLESQKIETFNTVSFAGFDEFETIAYLDVNLPLDWSDEVDEYGRFVDNDKKVAVPAINTYFNNINSNRITFVGDINVARDFQSGDPISGWDKGYTSIIPTTSLYTNAKNDIKLNAAKNGVVIKTPENDEDSITFGQWKDFTENVFRDNGSESSSKSSTTPSLRAGTSTVDPAIYILRDQETLITRMHYILQAHTAHNRSSVHNAAEYDDAWRYLTPSEKEWASVILSTSGTFLGDNLFTGTNLLNTNVAPADFVSYTTNSEINQGDATVNEWYANSIQKFNNNFFYRLIETRSTSNSSDNTGIQFPSKADTSDALNVVYEWMKPYVLGIINSKNYASFFPTNDPTKANSKSDEENLGKWIQINASSNFEASQIYNALTGKYSFVYPIKSISNGLEGSKLQGGVLQTFKQYNKTSDPSLTLNEIWFFPSTFDGGFFNTISSSLLSSLIAYIICLFVIGVFISVIYRVPGLFGFATLLGLNILALLCFIVTAHALSFSVFLGLTTASVIFMIAILSILERTHKNLVLSNTTADSSFKKAISSGVWPVVDLFLITIIISTCFIYFGPLSIYEFGLLTLLFSLLAIGMFALWLVATFLFFSNQLMRRHKRLMYNGYTVTDTVALAPATIANNDSNYETSYLTHKWKSEKTYKLFTKKFEFKSLMVVISVVLLIFAGLLVAGILLQDSIGGQNNAIINTVIAFAVALGFLSLYALIRLNWTSFLSIAAANVVISVVVFPIAYLTKSTTFNEALCVMASLYIILNVFLFHFVSNVNNHWVKHQFLIKQNLRDVINIETRSAYFYFYTHAFWICFFMFVSLALFSPMTLLPLFGMMFIMFELGMVGAYFTVKFIIIYFIEWRNNYRKVLYEREFFIDTSLDRIDEQLIDGINHHKILKIEL